jgi:plastocyanin
MPRLSFQLSFVFALIVSLAAATAEAGWGTLKGKFVYAGAPPAPPKLDVNKDQEVCSKHPLVDESLLVDASGGVANVVVFVRTKNVEVAPSYESSAKETVIYDNKGCRFEPHILAMRITQTLELRNSDPIGHNSNMQPIGLQGINPLLPAGGTATYQFTRAQNLPVTITCNIHPWMKGYVVARDNPYVAISKPDGTFEIKDLPTGDLEFQAWQERSGYLNARDWVKGKFTETIKEGDNDLGEIKVDAALFNK